MSKLKTTVAQRSAWMRWAEQNKDAVQANRNAWAKSKNGKAWLKKNQKRKNAARAAWRKQRQKLGLKYS